MSDKATRDSAPRVAVISDSVEFALHFTKLAQRLGAPLVVFAGDEAYCGLPLVEKAKNIQVLFSEVI